MRTSGAGQVAYAMVMIALGIQGLHSGDFTPVWAPVPKNIQARATLVHLCAVISLTTGIGLLWKRSVGVASRVLFAYLALWWVVFRVWEIVCAPSSFPTWDGAAETTAMVAGAWVISRVAGDVGLRIARVLFGLSLVAFGLAHFIYLNDTATLVPRWLPAHVAWAYATGTAFLAAAAAVLTGVRARLAAALVTLQIGLFTLLVWVPIVTAGSKTAFVWSELEISVALTAASWAVADSYGQVHP